MKLAFLTATFPNISETFVYRECAYLAASQQVELHVFAIRRPDTALIPRPGKEVSCPIVYLRPGRYFGIFLANLLCVVTRPILYIRLFGLVTRELNRHPARLWRRLFFHFLAGVYLGRVFRRERFDAIHSHFSSATNIALFAHLASGIPFSYTVHANDDLFMGPLSFFEEKAMSARFIVANTEYNKVLFNFLTSCKYNDKTSVIYNAVDMLEFSDCAAKTSLNTPLRLLSVGRLVRMKGFHTALQAVALVMRKGIEVSYRIIGDGPQRAFLEETIKRLELRDTVELMGARSFEEVKTQLDWCDILLMPSEIGAMGQRDGFPNVIAEAMLAKRAVVATYVSDIPNVIKHNETGFLFPEKDEHALAELIAHVKDHEHDVCRIAERAYDVAVATFDSTKNHEELLRTLTDTST